MSQIQQLEKAISAFDEPSRYVAVDDGAVEEVSAQELLAMFYGLGKPPTPSQSISNASVIPLSIDSSDLVRAPAETKGPQQPQYLNQPFERPVLTMRPNAQPETSNDHALTFIEEPATGHFVRVRADQINLAGSAFDRVQVSQAPEEYDSVQKLMYAGLSWQHAFNWITTVLAGLAAGVALLQLFVGPFDISFPPSLLCCSLFSRHSDLHGGDVTTVDRAPTCHVRHRVQPLRSLDLASHAGQSNFLGLPKSGSLICFW